MNVEDLRTACRLSGIFPDELRSIPEPFRRSGLKQGTLVDLYYDTWESFSYEEHREKIRKRCIVYLPHGYRMDSVAACKERWHTRQGERSPVFLQCDGRRLGR